MSEQVIIPYGFGIKIALPHDAAVERTKVVLKEQGFGVLTEIDVRQTIKEKLGADFRRYVILGACNPPLAHAALQEDVNVGLLLPCNVIVYEVGDESVVAAMDPEAALGVAGRESLRPLAEEAKSRLKRALAKLAMENA